MKVKAWFSSLFVLFLSGSVFAVDVVITNQLDASLTIIDTDSLKIRGEITGVGGYPAGIGYCGDNRFIISSPDDAVITLIDSEKMTVLKQWTIGTGPLGIDCNGHTAVIADWYENVVYKLDVRNNDITSFPVGLAPSGVLIDAESNRLFVANRDEDSVLILDMATGSHVDQFTTGDAPFGLGLDRANNRLFVVNVRSADVTVFDLNTYKKIKTIDVGEWAYCIAFDNNGFAYVTNQDEDSVSVIELTSLAEVGRYEVGIAPEGIAYHNGTLWVVNWQQASVSILDGMDGHLIDEIGVGKGARSYGRFVGSDIGLASDNQLN